MRCVCVVCTRGVACVCSVSVFVSCNVCVGVHDVCLCCVYGRCEVCVCVLVARRTDGVLMGGSFHVDVIRSKRTTLLFKKGHSGTRATVMDGVPPRV